MNEMEIVYEYVCMCMRACAGVYVVCDWKEREKQFYDIMTDRDYERKTVKKKEKRARSKDKDGELLIKYR